MKICLYINLKKHIFPLKTGAGFSLKRGTAAANKVGAVNYVDRTTVRFSHVFTIIANVDDRTTIVLRGSRSTAEVRFNYGVKWMVMYTERNLTTLTSCEVGYARAAWYGAALSHTSG